MRDALVDEIERNDVLRALERCRSGGGIAVTRFACDVVGRLGDDRGCAGARSQRECRRPREAARSRPARLRRRRGLRAASPRSPRRRLRRRSAPCRRASAWRSGVAVRAPSLRLKSVEWGIGLTPAFTRSRPVRTRATPGIAAAAATSMRAMRRVRMRRAHEARVELARCRQVVDEPPLAAQQRIILDPLHRIAAAEAAGLLCTHGESPVPGNARCHSATERCGQSRLRGDPRVSDSLR